MKLTIINENRDPRGRIKVKSDVMLYNNMSRSAWYKVKSNKQGEYIEIKGQKYFLADLPKDLKA